MVLQVVVINVDIVVSVIMDVSVIVSVTVSSTVVIVDVTVEVTVSPAVVTATVVVAVSPQSVTVAVTVADVLIALFAVQVLCSRARILPIGAAIFMSVNEVSTFCSPHAIITHIAVYNIAWE